MPTGYTEIIENGGTFEQYVWRCARAFAPFIHMRDERLDAVLRDPTPSTYPTEELEKSRNELLALFRMTPKEIEKAANKANEEAHRNWCEVQAKKLEILKQYTNIRTQVTDWQPPTKEHEEFKKFMLSQIDLCLPDLTSPCPAPKKEEPTEWHADEIKRVQWSIEYYEKQLNDSYKRIKRHLAWINALRTSVPQPK